jgi:hypothetical protein
MQSVYQSNPNLGDPGAIEGQLRESVQRLQKLQLEMQKYQSYLSEMDMPQNGGYGSSNGGSRTSQNRSSGSDESLSRSASDLSQNNHHNKPSAPGTPLPSHGYGSVLFCKQYALLNLIEQKILLILDLQIVLSLG